MDQGVSSAAVWAKGMVSVAADSAWCAGVAIVVAGVGTAIE